ALAVAQLDILEPMPLFGQRPQRLGQKLEGLDLDAFLARPGAHDLARDADDVADVQEVQQSIGLLAHGVDATKKLDAPPAVLQVGKGDLALAADRAQAAGDAHGAAFEFRKAVEDLTSGVRAVKPATVGRPAGLHEPPVLVHAGRDLIINIRRLLRCGSRRLRSGRRCRMGRLRVHYRVTSRIWYLSTPAGALTSTMVPGRMPMMA